MAQHAENLYPLDPRVLAAENERAGGPGGEVREGPRWPEPHDVVIHHITDTHFGDHDLHWLGFTGNSIDGGPTPYYDYDAGPISIRWPRRLIQAAVSRMCR